MDLEVEIGPDHPHYGRYYQMWLENGKPGQIESMVEGWLRRSVTPNADDPRPVFVLVARKENPQSDDMTPFNAGYAGMMATLVHSIGARGSFPK